MEEALGRLHPQVVHFVVASVFVGLPLYLLALTRRWHWLRPTATILLAVGALASVVAAQSGHEAHEGIEDAPGLRAPIDKHEELGEDTRDILLGLLVAEVLALWLARSAGLTGADATSGRRKASTALTGLVGVGWVVGAGVLYEAAEHGGELVYGYAGGVGTRSGDPVDVQRLLIAGLYNQALADRAAGKHEDAARLMDELARRLPDDPQVRMLHAESLLEDRKDGRAVLDELAKLPSGPAGAPAAAGAGEEPEGEMPGMDAARGGPEGRGGPGGPLGGPLIRAALLKSDAYVLLGMPDSARAVLMALPEARRSSPPVADRLKKIGG